MIDEKKLLDELKYSLSYFRQDSDEYYAFSKCISLIERQPTIYDWIPCNQALPKLHLIRDIFDRPQNYMSDRVLVTMRSEECDGVRYIVSTDIMTGYDPEKVSWLMSCGYGGSAVYNQEIIAWMPLPETYKEE